MSLEMYEVRIEGYFSDVLPAPTEGEAIARAKANLPAGFMVDEALAWRVNSDVRVKHGRHES